MSWSGINLSAADWIGMEWSGVDWNGALKGVKCSMKLQYEKFSKAK